MREDRVGFVEFFGGDELVLPPAEAEERLNAYYRQRQEAALARKPGRRRPRTFPAWTCPSSSSRPASPTLTPLETIAPLLLQRLAAAHPDTVDAVFRKILRKRDFTWAEHGEALMRRRKAWYYERKPRPGVSVIGDRLLELAFGGRW